MNDDYLARNRPSFKRWASKVERETGTRPTRAEYKAAKAGVRPATIDELLYTTGTSKGWEVGKVTVNQWGDTRQVKAELRPAITAPVFTRPPTPLVVTGTRRTNPVTFVVPDSQNGFVLGPDGTLLPTHDPRAWELAIELAGHIQPATIVLLGDMIDFPMFSRFAKDPRARGLLQATFDATYDYLLRLRQAVPGARMYYIMGNHEARYSRAIGEVNDEYLSFRRVGEEHSVNSLEHILHFDTLDIEAVAPYGASVYLDDVQYTHGCRIGGTGGETAAKYLKDGQQSIVFGHTHRREVAWKTLEFNGMRREIFALSPGTICNLDLTPPLHAFRRDWQQGFAVIHSWGPELIPVREGRCFHGGREYVAA